MTSKCRTYKPREVLSNRPFSGNTGNTMTVCANCGGLPHPSTMTEIDEAKERELFQKLTPGRVRTGSEFDWLAWLARARLAHEDSAALREENERLAAFVRLEHEDAGEHWTGQPTMRRLVECGLLDPQGNPVGKWHDKGEKP